MKVVKTIGQLERLRLSANGNPRFRVFCTDGTVYETQTDAAINYSLSNPEFQDVPVEFTLERGKITYATPQEG